VQKLATANTLTDASQPPRKEFPLALTLNVFFLAALWFGLCRELSGEWSVNEQYNFGWFVPFFALYLFWLRWQDRPEPTADFHRQIADLSALAIAIVALLLLLPVRLFEIANPEWRLLAWTHAGVVVTLTLLVIWRAGGKAWLRHFAFPVAFIFVAVPWPTMFETPIIQGLMRIVARVAAETAMLLGTPAHVEGNLIRMSTGIVGVNEACSGIRSLQTSLMIGLLFGELKRLSTLRRVVLIACAVAIAVLANFVRAVFLVRIAATENLSAVGRWHDIVGYSIILLVFGFTLALAHSLGKTIVSPPKSEVRSGRFAIGGPYLAAAAICWILLMEIGTASWYRFHERNLISSPQWSVQWPEQAANFRKLNVAEEIRAVLRFDEARAASWTIDSPTTSSDPVSCLFYVFRWSPGKNSALLANLHRPDVCLPASGWTQVADHGVRTYPINGSFELPFRHFEFDRRFEDSPPQTAHAFYCLSEDRASEASTSHHGTNFPGMFGSRSEWTRAERFRAVLEGRRHLGQQVMEVIFVSAKPLSGADAEAQLRDLVGDVVVPRVPQKSF
jgi:exosortase